MINPRKGLRRIGQREWLVEGPCGQWVIERERPKCWYVRGAGVPRAFYNGRYHRLGDARTAAEGFAHAMPYFLDRRTA